MLILQSLLYTCCCFLVCRIGKIIGDRDQAAKDAADIEAGRPIQSVRILREREERYQRRMEEKRTAKMKKEADRLRIEKKVKEMEATKATRKAELAHKAAHSEQQAL